MKKIKKQRSLACLALIICALSHVTSYHFICAEPVDQEPIRLDSKFLQFIDGQPFGINTTTFGCLLQIRLNLKRFLYGSGTNAKLCILNDSKLTIQEVARLELKNEKIYKTKKAHHEIYIEGTNDDEWQAIKKEYTDMKQTLEKSLAKAKDDFIEFILPFFDHVRSIKKQMVPLIIESCEKHNRTESLLPTCLNSSNGKEVDYFEKHVTNFKQLGFMCLDIIHFTTDLINSCPKAREQFEQLRVKKEGEYQQSIIDSVAP